MRSYGTCSLLNIEYIFLFKKFLQFDEQKDQMVVERVLRVVFLDVDHPSPVSTWILIFRNYLESPIM